MTIGSILTQGLGVFGGVHRLPMLGYYSKPPIVTSITLPGYVRSSFSLAGQVRPVSFEIAAMTGNVREVFTLAGTTRPGFSLPGRVRPIISIEGVIQ